MFNLKKAQAQFVSPFTPKVTVKMIHDEFDTAVDKLISQALNIPESQRSKHDRLKALGFGLSAPVKQLADLVAKEDNIKNTSQFVVNYREKYPFNKFITRDLVETICKKYGLVLGDVGDYIGDIPDKNISEIEDFKKYPIEKVPYKEVYPDSMNNMFFSYGMLDHLTDPPLKICAPVKDFKMTGKKLSGIEIVAEDPIVLQQVNGGYLIVSKWGDEASDEALVNETMN